VPVSDTRAATVVLSRASVTLGIAEEISIAIRRGV